MVALSDALGIIQTVALIGGFLGFLFEYRSHGKERGYSTYLQASLQYIGLERMMMQDKDLEEVYTYAPAYKALDDATRKRWHYYYMLISVLEIVYLAHIKGWMGQDEWDGWDERMAEIVREGHDFMGAWDDAKDWHSSKFVSYIDSLVEKPSK